AWRRSVMTARTASRYWTDSRSRSRLTGTTTSSSAITASTTSSSTSVKPRPPCGFLLGVADVGVLTVAPRGTVGAQGKEFHRAIDQLVLVGLAPGVGRDAALGVGPGPACAHAGRLGREG